MGGGGEKSNHSRKLRCIDSVIYDRKGNNRISEQYWSPGINGGGNRKLQRGDTETRRTLVSEMPE